MHIGLPYEDYDIKTLNIKIFQHLLQANAARNLQVVNMNPLCLNALLLERTFHFMQSR